MDANCEKCASNHFSSERIGTRANGHFSICCDNGKTCDLPPFAEPTPVLQELLTDDTTSARAFRDEIRSYNAALAFMSLGAKVSAPSGHGLNVFRIHGAICHYYGALLPTEGIQCTRSCTYMTLRRPYITEC